MAGQRRRDPVGYPVLMSLVAGASVVLTDSGGLQKESVLLGTRCLTLRAETEWPETLEGGWNTVVDLDVDAARAALERPVPAGTITTLGGGTAAEAIVAALLEA